MIRTCAYISIAILSLASRSPLAQDSVLECFSRDLNSASKISACSHALAQDDLSDETRALALVSRGAARAQSNDKNAALIDYDASLKLIPDDFSTRLARGRLLEERGQRQAAEVDFSRVIDRAPPTQEVLLGEAYARRGALRLEIGDTSSGISDLGEARRFDPRNPMPFKARGAYFLKENDIEQAAAELEQAANLNAGDVEVQLMLGSVQLRRGQSDSAVRAFSSTLIVKPNNAEGLRGRAAAYGQKQNYAAAITDYTAALNINGKDIAALEGRGAALLRIGAFAAATHDFDKLLTLMPENNRAVFFRANARFQSGDPVGAAADFSAILSRQPANADALLGRGIARQFLGNYVGAETDFTALLKEVPDAAQPLANRGYARVMAGAFSAASEDLMKAMSRPNAPKHLALWKFVADARAGNSKPDTLTLAMRGMDPAQWPAPLMRYFLGEAAGNEVISAAIEVPKVSSGRLCETYFFLGQAALMLSDTTEAQRLFKAAIDTGAVRFTEYAGARAELSRLTKTNE